MKQIFIIGTIHQNSTPKEELEPILDSLQPDKILIELSPNELGASREESIRDEMFAAYDWAQSKSIVVDIFDVEESSLKEGITGTEPEFVALEQKVKKHLENVNNYSWKDLNDPRAWNNPEVEKLEQQITDTYFDIAKIKEREEKMLENIREKLIDGKNIILTGAGHLSFFKKNLPEAIFPFWKQD